MKRYVACYDISSNSRRTKVMKRLRNRGFHAQLSFFELEDPDSSVKQIRELLEDLDRFALVRLSPKGKIKRIGSIFEGTEWVL